MRIDKDKAYTYFLAALIGILCALLVLACSGYGYVAARGEESPRMEALYKMESEAMRLSEAPIRASILDLAMVDIDPKALEKDAYILAKVWFPAGVDDCIEGVVLFDGWHLASAQWQKTADNALIITFRAADLKQFDGTVGLYLVLVGHGE